MTMTGVGHHFFGEMAKNPLALGEGQGIAVEDWTDLTSASER